MTLELQRLNEKGAKMLKQLSTIELIDFAKYAPLEILDMVLNELETRMPSKEFVSLCNQL